MTPPHPLHRFVAYPASPTGQRAYQTCVRCGRAKDHKLHSDRHRKETS